MKRKTNADHMEAGILALGFVKMNVTERIGGVEHKAFFNHDKREWYVLAPSGRLRHGRQLGYCGLVTSAHARQVLNWGKMQKDV